MTQGDGFSPMGSDGLLPHELPDDTQPEGPRRGRRRPSGRGRWDATVAILFLAVVPFSCVCMPYGPGMAASAVVLGALLYLTSPHTTPATRRLYLVAAVVAWVSIAAVYAWGAFTGFTWTVPWAPSTPAP